MRYLARICYDGSKFQGFQRQKDGSGVQNELERVLSKIFHSNILVKGAGRTDKGVHALDQCVHFDLDFDISTKKLQHSFNQMLPSSISVTSISVVDNQFHARYSVKEKTYVYKLYVGPKNPFVYSYAYPIFFDVNVSKMKEACKLFLGVHDFHNFVSGERENYMSRIDDFQIREEDNYILFEVRGKSFYRYMVRSLVGALLDVGRGKVDISSITLALEYPNRNTRFSVVPSEGLYLMKIEY